MDRATDGGGMDLVRWSFAQDVERGVLSKVSIFRSTHACAAVKGGSSQARWGGGDEATAAARGLRITPSHS